MLRSDAFNAILHRKLIEVSKSFFVCEDPVFATFLLFLFVGVPLLGWLIGGINLILRGGWSILFGALSIVIEIALIIFAGQIMVSSMSVVNPF
jgi:hypothetical protein